MHRWRPSAEEWAFIRLLRQLSIVFLTFIPFVFAQTEITFSNTAEKVQNKAWNWTLFVQGPPEMLSRIRCVSYHLDRTFPNPDRTICEEGSSDQPFALQAQAWSEFDIPIDIVLRDGTTQHASYHLRLHTSRTHVRELSQPRFVNGVRDYAIDRGGKLLAIAREDVGIDILQLPSLDRVQSFGPNFKIASLGFNPEGNALFTLEFDGTFRTWNLSTQRAEKLQRTLASNVNAGWFHPSGGWFLITVPTRWGSGLFDLNILNVTNLSQRFQRTLTSNLLIDFPDSGDRILIYSGDRMLISGSKAKHLQLWTLDSRTRLIFDEPWTGAQIRALALSHQGTIIATTEGKRTVTLIRVAPRRAKTLEFPSNITEVCFTPGDDGLIAVTDRKQMYLKPVIENDEILALSTIGGISRIEFSPEGSWMTVLGFDRKLEVRSVTYQK